MSSGIVVRSMILSAGYVVALDDGMISWRPNFGRRTNYRMQYPASVLLGMKGPTGDCESIVIGDVKGKTCVIVDDIVDSGGTIVNAARALKARGAKDVYVYITHGVLSGEAVDKIRKSVGN